MSRGSSGHNISNRQYYTEMKIVSLARFCNVLHCFHMIIDEDNTKNIFMCIFLQKYPVVILVRIAGGGVNQKCGPKGYPVMGQDARINLLLVKFFSFHFSSQVLNSFQSFYFDNVILDPLQCNHTRELLGICIKPLGLFLIKEGAALPCLLLAHYRSAF